MSFVPPVAFGDTLSYRVVKRGVFSSDCQSTPSQLPSPIHVPRIPPVALPWETIPQASIVQNGRFR